MDLVSILLLSWNHEKYIEQCIESCIQQTYKNIEIIYLDNNSTDSSYLLATALLEKSGVSYKTFKNDTAKSIAANFNFLFSKSSGDYIAVLSTDDWFDIHNIYRKVELFKTNKQTGAVFSGGWIYFDSEKRLEQIDASNFRRGHIFRELMLVPGATSNVGNCYRREAIQEAGGWDESQFIEDVDLNVQIAKKYEFDFIAEPLVYYRRMSSTASANVAYMIKGYQAFYNKYKQEDWIDMRKYLGKRYVDFAAVSVDQGKYAYAFELLLKSMTLNGLGLNKLRVLAYLIRKSIGALFR